MRARPENEVLNHYCGGCDAKLVFAQVGKCGGISLEEVIRASPVVKLLFQSWPREHLHPPEFNPQSHYMLVVRNPISRSVSALNWRYHLAVETGNQKNRFPGEFEVLEKYSTVRCGAENLYQDGVENHEAVRDLLTVHHMKESIAALLYNLVLQSCL